MTSFWRDDIDPDHDLHKVMIKRDKLVDANRNDREVKLKVYYPILKDEDLSGNSVAYLKASDAQTRYGQTKFPVIIWSHGLGGSVDGAAFISRYVASYGYVVVHLQHHGTDSSLWEGKKGHPWDIIRQSTIPRSATLNRFKDVPFVLDQLPQWFEEHPEAGDVVDLSTLGMSGHSFGALTTQVMAGMMFPDEGGRLRRAREDRFKAGILYSPGPIAHLSMDDPSDIHGFIDLPLFHMTGTDDSSPVEDWDYTKRLTVYDHSKKAEKLLLILKDGDHMVFNGSRGKLGQNPNRETHERILRVVSLAYWDAMLKDDAAAKAWLIEGGFKEWLGEGGEFR